MQNWSLSDLARASGNHLVQASRFADEEPEAQREGTTQDHTLSWWLSGPPKLALSTPLCNI